MRARLKNINIENDKSQKDTSTSIIAAPAIIRIVYKEAKTITSIPTYCLILNE